MWMLFPLVFWSIAGIWLIAIDLWPLAVALWIYITYCAAEEVVIRRRRSRLQPPVS